MSSTPDDVVDKLADLHVGEAEPPASAGAYGEESSTGHGHTNGGAGSGVTPRTGEGARPGSDARKLFVGGLPQRATEDQVSGVFSQYGTVEEVHLIKPNPSSESKRGCCFVTFATVAEADEAMKGLNGQVVEALSPSMPLLVRVADPPRSREEQRTRQAAQQAQQRLSAQVGVVQGWPPGTFGYSWPPQAPGAFPATQPGQPVYVPTQGAANAGAASAAQYMGVFPGGYGFGMVPQQFATQHGEWSEHTDSDGNKYYYNSQSGVSQWEPPPQWPHQQTPQVPMMYPYGQPMPASYFVQPPSNGGGAPGDRTRNSLGSSGKRGPKGANLAVFCIPNAYTDVELHDIARDYGTVVYAQVSRHRDTGLSRGYGFVSYETVEEADKAIQGIHGIVVQGRALRVEKVKADEDQPQSQGQAQTQAQRR